MVENGLGLRVVYGRSWSYECLILSMLASSFMVQYPLLLGSSVARTNDLAPYMQLLMIHLTMLPYRTPPMQCNRERQKTSMLSSHQASLTSSQ